MLDSKTKQAEDIFWEAQALRDDAAQLAFVQQACGGDDLLRAKVEDMLSAQTDGNRFFAEAIPAIATVADLVENATLPNACSDDQVPGTRIGPYKLLQRIGEGGHGIVYMAEQDEPMRRRVALKLIKLGMDTPSVIARFEAERQALAMMDHPNIARVLDAGATGAGRPFFVMELVRGVRITDYCDASKLNTRQRLELFIQVCSAIQHAHQKGIVHRDIKPSNVLVTTLDGAALPKVIDFGVAKAIAEKLTDKTLFTLYGHVIGTPAYMSPEQAQMSAMDVDTRSDIYSVGVLLYELLSGKTPFEQKELIASGIDEMRRTLRDKEPDRPSTRLNALPAAELAMTAQRRNVQPQELRSALKGDLDWIVMRALEKDRNRRYQTVNALAADVRRYIDNEPVTARPPTGLYRFRKLVRRNKIVFTAGGGVALAITVGFAFSTYMFFRERSARKEQVRLRKEAVDAREAADRAREIADQALTNEARLRREAEARAKISEAAFLLSRGRFEHADQLVEKLSLPIIQPSLEAADVLRRLALWHVSRGYWRAAAARLLKLVEASQIDKTDMTDAATRDLLMVGPVLVAIGDTAGYHRFRDSVIERFSKTRNWVAAEQVVKATTLLPFVDKTSESLQPLATILEESLVGAPESGPQRYATAWRTFALTRFEYRRGNFANTVRCGRTFLALEDLNPPRIASCHLLLALAYQKLGQSEQAQAELATARTLIGRQFPYHLDSGLPTSGESQVYWYDWVEALVLQNEAIFEITGARPPRLISASATP